MGEMRKACGRRGSRTLAISWHHHLTATDGRGCGEGMQDADVDAKHASHQASLRALHRTYRHSTSAAKLQHPIIYGTSLPIIPACQQRLLISLLRHTVSFPIRLQIDVLQYERNKHNGPWYADTGFLCWQSQALTLYILVYSIHTGWSQCRGHYSRRQR